MIVHCLFEQSGTFKNEFKELGYEAYDYDIENNFNETDYQVDLFNEIEKGYKGYLSIFDKITNNDLIVAFFPCTYFSIQNEIIFDGKQYGTDKWDKDRLEAYIREREREREYLTYYLSLLR